MEAGGQRTFLFRLLAEFFAIFAGAVLALSADGWRDLQSEEQEARAGLELVQSDLEADSAQFGPVRSTMSRWMRDAAWLIGSWDRRDLPADSVALVFDSFTRSEAILNFNRSGFDGLRDANRLRLIDDRTVRRGLMDYYETRQPQIGNSFDKAIERVDELYRLAAPYVLYEQDTANLSLWPLVDARVRLRRPWADLQADPVLYTAILLFGRWAGVTASYLETEESTISDLLRLSRSELADP